ncbi:hypothetical protein Tco_1357642, partial [Tanacetum coccineum]
EGGGALGSLGALKPSTHPVTAIFLYPLGAKMEVVEALDLVEVEAVRALELVKVGALDVVGLSLNILISASVSGYLTSLNKTTSSSPNKPSSIESSSSLDS